MDWRTTKVLDHGFVHLRDSMPVPYPNHVDGLNVGDYRVEEAARVSTNHLPADILDAIGEERDGEPRGADKTKKLIKYMFDNGHSSPFEQVQLQFVAKLPIFVARQWIRHRTQAYNEKSARYSKLESEFYIPPLERMQAQSTANKQGSADQLPEYLAEGLRQSLRNDAETAYAKYESYLDHGLTRELARTVLPTSIYTTWYASVSLHNCMGFMRQRCDSHAQWEIRQYANAMLEMARHVAPYTISLFCEKYGFGGADV